MSERIIYAKKYPCLDEAEDMELFPDLELPDVSRLTPEERYEVLMSPDGCIPLPKRIQDRETFVRAAIVVSKLYEFDVKITRSSDHISVEYHIPAGSCPHDILHVCAMADECFFNTADGGDTVVLELDYYTHASVSFGAIISRRGLVSMTVTFCGHKEVDSYDQVQRWLQEVVAYVEHDWGGAAATMQHARRKKRRVVQFDGAGPH